MAGLSSAMRIRFLDISVSLAIFALARHTGLPVINNYLNTISQIATHCSDGRRRGGPMDETMRAAFSRCSRLLRSAFEVLNPPLPAPALLPSEIDTLRTRGRTDKGGCQSSQTRAALWALIIVFFMRFSPAQYRLISWPSGSLR